LTAPDDFQQKNFFSIRSYGRKTIMMNQHKYINSHSPPPPPPQTTTTTTVAASAAAVAMELSRLAFVATPDA
jgi:hypothetical protein